MFFNLQMSVCDLVPKSKKMSCAAAVFTVLIVISYFPLQGECRPYYRWFDYDNFSQQPQSKPLLEGAPGDILGIVNPLRPYEPWVLDCNTLFTDKVEPGKRHPRCKEVDETNEKEYSKYLLHVQQWEEAYPDRAERWNTRFPEAKETEKKRYEQLKSFADSHNPNLDSESDVELESLPSSTSTQRAECKNTPHCDETTTAKANVKGYV